MSTAQRVGYGCLVLGLAVTAALACDRKADEAVPGGQPCEQGDRCEGGWLCYDRVCRKVCNGHWDCAKTEACQPGVCMPVADLQCSEDSDCDQPSGCESMIGAECYAGQCHYEPLEVGRACDDGDACTGSDQCDSAGVCRGEAMVCHTPPADFCSPDSVFRDYADTGVCNPSLGSCEYEYHDTACSDCRHECLGLPYAPANLVASAGDAEVTLTWAGIDGALSYNVYVSQSQGGTTSAVPVSDAGSPHVRASLANGSTYYFAVSAVVAAGEGDLSGEVPATPRISAPTQVSAESGDKQVAITWETVPGADRYNLYWAQASGVTTESSLVSDVTSPFVHGELDNGTTYYLALTAVDGSSESELSAEVWATPRISAPAQVQVEPGDQQVTITWELVPGADSYNLFWAEQSGVALDSNRLNGVTSPYVHAALVNGTKYYYALTAVDGPSQSELSAEVSATAGRLQFDSGTKLAAFGAGELDRFGVSVAVSGDYAIAGAPWEDGGDGDPSSEAGSAYVFHYDGSGWDAGTRLVAPDVQAGDHFGNSVALSGDYAIVGAYLEDGGDDDPLPNAGAAYVFLRTGPNTWDAGTKLVASDAQANDNFGGSVALSGDYAVVGALGEDGGSGDPVEGAGAAYVFERAGTNSWSSGTKLVASDAQGRDEFGWSVAISGEYAVVGAAEEDGGAGDPLDAAGAAYVYRRTGSGSWVEETKLKAPDAQEGGLFGCSVALSGDLAIVGGTADDTGGPGAVYAFKRTDVAVWDSGTKLVAPDAQAGDGFGRAVALSDGVAVVGRPGAVYVLEYDGLTWEDSGLDLVAPDAQAGDQFGTSVAVSADFVMVGAYLEDGGDGDPLPGAGAAYVFSY